MDIVGVVLPRRRGSRGLGEQLLLLLLLLLLFYSYDILRTMRARVEYAVVHVAVECACFLMSVEKH